MYIEGVKNWHHDFEKIHFWSKTTMPTYWLTLQLQSHIIASIHNITNKKHVVICEVKFPEVGPSLFKNKFPSSLGVKKCSETNTIPLKIGGPKKRPIFQPSISQGQLLVREVTFRSNWAPQHYGQAPGDHRLVHQATTWLSMSFTYGRDSIEQAYIQCIYIIYIIRIYIYHISNIKK